MADAAAPPDDTQCSICYEEIALQGVLDACKHLFCFPCIFKWSNTANTCPMCKVRFHAITKIDRTATASAIPAGNGRKRKGQPSTPKPEKVRVKKRDARFHDDPSDYTQGYRNELLRRMHDHEPAYDEAPYMPFWSRAPTLLRDFLFSHARREPTPPRPLSRSHRELPSEQEEPFLHFFENPPPPHQVRHVEPEWIYRPPSRPHVARPAAAAGPPVVIDLTEDEPELSRNRSAVIDLTGDAPVEILVDDEVKSLTSVAPAAALPQSRLPPQREEHSYQPRRLQINITGGSPQIGIFNVSVPRPPPSNGTDRQSDVSIDSIYWD